LRSDYREFQYCIPEARDGYNLGTASGSQISGCLNPAVTRYVITWARFELCPRYKSPSSVTRRGASIGLTWLLNRPKPAFPPLLSGSRLGRVLGEGGAKSSIADQQPATRRTQATAATDPQPGAKPTTTRGVPASLSSRRRGTPSPQHVRWFPSGSPPRCRSRSPARAQATTAGTGDDQ